MRFLRGRGGGGVGGEFRRALYSSFRRPRSGSQKAVQFCLGGRRGT